MNKPQEPTTSHEDFVFSYALGYINTRSEPMFSDSFAEGGKTDNPHKWHAKPAETCEHEWVESIVTLEFESGKQQVPGFRCAKCPMTKIVAR